MRTWFSGPLEFRFKWASRTEFSIVARMDILRTDHCFFRWGFFMNDQSDFMKKVEGIRLAEKEAEDLIMSAKQKAEKILQDAKNQAGSLKLKNNENIVKMKNELINTSKNEIEKQVAEMIKKETSAVSKVRNVCIDKKQAQYLVDWFLDSV